MNVDYYIALTILISFIILNNHREQFFYLVYFISIGANYNKIIQLFKDNSIPHALFRLIIVYFISYFLIKDPNPFYHLLLFFLPFQNYFRGLFILVFLSYFLNSKNKKMEYFLSSIISNLTKKKASIIILLLVIITIIVFCYNDKLFIYLLNSNSVLNKQKYYITTLQYNSEKILSDWINEMKKLIPFLGYQNVIFSAIENGDSTDNTAKLLIDFGSYLDKHNIPNKIITKRIVKKKNVERIDFLSRLRNRALDLLYETPNINFDNTKILFFNDIIFSYENIVKLLMTNNNNYDAVCGMDYFESFYDTWASYGLDFHMPRYYYPHFVNKVAQDSYVNGETVRMFSCWNGVIIYKATPFKEKKVYFRSGNYIRQSECLLMNSDLYDTGYRKVMINTQVKVAYDYYYYYMNKYVYPWTKNLFTYFYYYFRFIHIKNNINMSNLNDNNITLCPILEEFRIEFLLRKNDPRYANKTYKDYYEDILNYARYLY